MLASAPSSTAVAPRRPALPSLGDSERDRRSRSQPRPRCPGSAASRSTFLPTSWSAPREPAPESSLLGRSRPRASARRPSRRSMCGRACTPRTRAAARARTGAGSRLAAWPARPFKFLSHSAAAKRLKVQIGTSLVAGACRHGGAVGHRRELSDPGIRARLAGAALRASALTPIAQRDTHENRNRASK